MNRDSSTEASVRQRFFDLADTFDERQRRLWAAAEAKALGYGGVSLVSRITGVSRRAIHSALGELESADAPPPGKVRRPGGGRKPVVRVQAGLPAALEALVEPEARGDPDSPLRWTSHSIRHLAGRLKEDGFDIGREKVRRLLRGMRYRLQGNRKGKERGGHPDRDAQFKHIAARVKDFLSCGRPAVSVDAKKKELVGDFRNAGKEWRPEGEPGTVDVHDFITDALGKAIPYGVYDLAANAGWVSIGRDHDTAAFAAETIRRWGRDMGEARYRGADRLLVTADGGGSSSWRCRLWKTEPRRLADGTGLRVEVCHYPPGTSKWNKIEHRLFGQIAANWRGKPLRDWETILGLVSSTRTETGLVVRAELDEGTYPTGVKVGDEELAAVNLSRNGFHGEWNYTVKPS
ncbi:MAG: ISAzo13 family transposase [Gemmataceae bacterium]|nr:ISAzo13 family transposase [Gemmataceae bacterium]